MFYLQRKYKIETEVENWIQKYDTDMGERQVRLIYIFFFTQEINKEKSHRLGSFVWTFHARFFREFDTVEAADDWLRSIECCSKFLEPITT